MCFHGILKGPEVHGFKSLGIFMPGLAQGLKFPDFRPDIGQLLLPPYVDVFNPLEEFAGNPFQGD